MEHKVDIALATFNHKDTIERAIRSCLEQKTNFKFRIIIGDDCSTDGTTDIVRKYAQNFPDVIVPKIRSFNTFSTDYNRRNGILLLEECEAPYIALLDGDDYWIDENKLQSQVDFLETNESYSGIGSNSILSSSNQKYKKYLKKEAHDYTLSLDGVKKEGFRLPFQTSTYMFRRKVLTDMTYKVLAKSFAGDYVLCLSALNFGNLKYEAKPSSVYRVHGDGVNTLTRPFRAYRTVLFGKPNLADLFENRLVLSKTRMMFWKGMVKHSSRKDYLKTFYLLLVLMFSKTDTMHNKKGYFNFFFSNIFK